MPVLTLDVTKRVITDDATVSVNWNGVQPTVGSSFASDLHPVDSLPTTVVPDSEGDIGIANLEGYLDAIGYVAISLELDLIYFISREKVA
jgi:hypothetical protein